MADNAVLVDQITRPVAAEAALVVSADIKPLSNAHEGHRWFAPAGGVVFARDPGLDGNGPTAVMDAPGRAGQFPQVTAFLDAGDVDAHADSLFVLGVAPDGTRVTGDEVNRNRHTFSRISVQVAGTCTLAARKTERFRFGDLVCASLQPSEVLQFNGADADFVTRNLQPWQPNQTRDPRGTSTLSPAAISYNLLYGLRSILAANPSAKLVEAAAPAAPATGAGAAPVAAFEVGAMLQGSWSRKTWMFLRDRFEWPGDVVTNSESNANVQIGDSATEIKDDVTEFAGVAFDGDLRAEIKRDKDGTEHLDRAAASKGPIPGAISLSDADQVRKIIKRYTKIRDKIGAKDSWDCTTTYSQTWRAVADAEYSADGNGITLFPKPKVTAPLGVVSLTKANQESLMLCLFYEALGRGPLALKDDTITGYLAAPGDEWMTKLAEYSALVDAVASGSAGAAERFDAEIKTHRRAALRWAGTTTAPFARVLEARPPFPCRRRPVRTLTGAAAAAAATAAASAGGRQRAPRRAPVPSLGRLVAGAANGRSGASGGGRRAGGIGGGGCQTLHV